MAIRVLIADDSDVLRHALETYLCDSPEVTIVGSTETAEAAKTAIAELKPDVVLFDLHMKLSEPLQKFGNTRLIAMTFGADEQDAELAKNIGADALIDKCEITQKLLPAILQEAEPKSS
jgi:DNA-binding NarL/FixJ family response regulator